MSEQAGRGEPADQPESGQPRDAGRPGSGRSQQPGRRQPSSDVLGDLQRWLIRSSARNMRSQFEDQVRRTLSGHRPDKGDVWDIATTEIPPEVGEAPECQWCPICRAARRMRGTGPGLTGQLTGAGDAVAAAVQDAVRAFDGFLGRTAGASDRAGSPDLAEDPESGGLEPDADQSRPAATHPDPAGPGAAGPPDSMAGEHGPVGWKPGDRLATAGPVADTWATATAPGEPADGGTSDEIGTSGSSSFDGPEGRDHGPSDRG